MIFIPLPFVLTVLLLVLLVQMLQRRQQGSVGDWLFIALICAYMVRSVFLGLRWGYDMVAVMPVQIVLASLIATLAYLSFFSLTQDETTDKLHLRKLLPHFAPALVIILLLYTYQRDLAAYLLSLQYLLCGLALLRLTKAGTDILVTSRLDGAMRSFRAMQITGLLLISSVLIDFLINLDFAVTSGRYTPVIIMVTNILSLILLTVAAGIVVNNRQQEPQGITEEEQPVFTNVGSVISAEQQQDLMVQLDELMEKKQLYKDMELNLVRIARQLRKPARHVSEAVNRCRGLSVSVYVNNLRVTEACRLLRETNESVTQVSFASGFMTKSNFNREFMRVTSMSPKTYRAHTMP